jgi:hypothetical protein
VGQVNALPAVIPKPAAGAVTAGRRLDATAAEMSNQPGRRPGGRDPSRPPWVVAAHGGKGPTEVTEYVKGISGRYFTGRANDAPALCKVLDSIYQ